MDPNALNGGLPPGPTGDGPSRTPGDGAAPVSIPDHQLLRCIGRGSYGTVWLAKNMMGMFRAVKIVFRKSFEDQKPFERELSGIRTFEPISRSHEGFIDVLHVGINESEGYFYYVMELGDDQISGQNINPENYAPKTLAKEIASCGKLTLPECLRLGLALSHALSELHGHELVHRDVKPSNIIFVNGVPKLADIGLVAEAREARSYVGTEGFIPPEGPGTPQADIYSLGKVLYEASTGKDRQEFPELPTQLDKLPDRDGFLELNEVILTACKNDISKRYQFAWDMHADLLVLANGKSVKRLKLLERRLANLKRAAAISVLVLAILAAIFYQVYREWRNVAEARERQVGANVAYGNRAMESGDLLGALPYFAGALQLDERNASQEAHRLRIGSVLAQCPKLTHMWFLTNQVHEVQFSPDGRKVLLLEGRDNARIYDLQTDELYMRPFGKDIQPLCGAFSPDGRRVALGGYSACIWDAIELKEVCRLLYSNWVYSVRFSPDGSRIVTACNDGIVRLWDARTGKLERELTGHTDAIRFADFSHDGRLIVSTSRDGSARLWDVATGHPVGTPLWHKDKSWVNYAAFSPDDQILITAGNDRAAHAWKAPDWDRLRPDLNHRDAVMSVEFSPDGRLILTACLDGTIRLWNANDLLPFKPLPMLRQGERVMHASFDRNARQIIVACSEGPTRIWDLAGTMTPSALAPCSFNRDGTVSLTLTNATMEVRNTISGQPTCPPIPVGPSVESAELNSSGRFALVISRQQTDSGQTNRLLQTFNVVTGKAVAPEIIVSNLLSGSALSGDGKHLVILNDKTAQIWDIAAQKLSSPPLVHPASNDAAFFSPDSTRLAVRAGNCVYVYNVLNSQPVFRPLEHPRPAHFAEFSPNQAYLVTCCSDNYLDKWYAQVWNATTGEKAGPPLRHSDGVLYASFSPDSRRVVTSGEDFNAFVWQTATGEQLTRPLEHEDQIQTAGFSPDCKWVVTASSDRTARIWNSDTGDPLTPPLQHLARLVSGRFLADGRRIVTVDVLGHFWLSQLSVDNRPIEDLRKVADLLSGQSITPADGMGPSRSESLERIWHELRAKYPADFTVSPEQVTAWHEFEAGRSEREKEWFTAVFHLEALLAARPDDQSLSNRLVKAKKR